MKIVVPLARGTGCVRWAYIRLQRNQWITLCMIYAFIEQSRRKHNLKIKFKKERKISQAVTTCEAVNGCNYLRALAEIRISSVERRLRSLSCQPCPIPEVGGASCVPRCRLQSCASAWLARSTLVRGNCANISLFTSHPIWNVPVLRIWSAINANRRKWQGF